MYHKFMVLGMNYSILNSESHFCSKDPGPKLASTLPTFSDHKEQLCSLEPQEGDESPPLDLVFKGVN